MMVLVYSSLEEHLGVYEEVAWAATSGLTQVCLRVTLDKGSWMIK